MSGWRDPSRERLETYLTRVPPERWGEITTAAQPISKEEWLAYVASDEEIEAVEGESDQWRLLSHLDGEPLRFENGAILLAKNDAVTIEWMVKIAPRFEAFVIDEHGQRYQALAGETPGATPRFRSQVHDPVRVDTEEERLRKRQALVVLLAGATATVGLVWWITRGQAGAVHYLSAAGALALAAWAAVRFFASVFVLERSGGEIVVTRRSTRSTEDAISQVVFEPGTLTTLELVWFPLEYPNLTRIEFHVRAQGHPWLVLLATYDEERARRTLRHLSRRLLLAAHDRTSEAPAHDVPSRYRLTPDEKRGVAARAPRWMFPAVFAALGAGFWLGGFLRVATLFFALSLVLLVGGIWTRPPPVAEKYRPWLV